MPPPDYTVRSAFPKIYHCASALLIALSSFDIMKDRKTAFRKIASPFFGGNIVQNWRDQLPPQVSGRAQTMGNDGIQWLEKLNHLIFRLEEMWAIRVNSVLNGGSHAFIGCAADSSGKEYILKIELPDYSEEAFLQGAAMLVRADGKGYCRLYQVDASKRAVLLEKLGAPLRCSGKSAEEQMRIICSALLETWNIPLNGDEADAVQGNYGWFRSFLPSTWESEDKPCHRSVIDTALGYVNWLEARTRPQEYVWVHGDAHNNNMLHVPGAQIYKFIDPDGRFFEKSYDVGVLMREWPEEYLANPLEKGKERSRFLSELTGVPEPEIWAWGYLQMTATALILHQIGQKELAETMLKIAEAWT